LEKETRALMVPTENAIHPRGLCRRHLTPPPPISIHICTRLRWRKSFVNKSVTLVAELFLVWRRATTRTRQSTVDRADISGQGRWRWTALSVVCCCFSLFSPPEAAIPVASLEHTDITAKRWSLSSTFRITDLFSFFFFFFFRWVCWGTCGRVEDS
jgi:hypothetical protein